MTYQALVQIMSDWNWLLSGLSAGAFAAFFSWFINEMKNKPNLQIYQRPKAPSYYFPAENNADNYVAPYRLVSWIRLENLSERPITIVEFHIKPIGYDRLISTVSSESVSSYTIAQTPDGKRRTIPVADNHLKPLIMIEPFGAREGFVFFPMCPEIKEDCIKANLTVLTTRGTFQFTCVLKRGSFEDSI